MSGYNIHITPGIKNQQLVADVLFRKKPPEFVSREEFSLRKDDNTIKLGRFTASRKWCKRTIIHNYRPQARDNVWQSNQL